MAGNTSAGPKIVKSERLDGIDREKFEEMLASPSFGLYYKRLVAELIRTQTVCETVTDAPEVYRAQGRISALRMATNLPQKLLEEMQQPKR
jgi:hypothetical protein